MKEQTQVRRPTFTFTFSKNSWKKVFINGTKDEKPVQRLVKVEAKEGRREVPVASSWQRFFPKCEDTCNMEDLIAQDHLSCKFTRSL